MISELRLKFGRSSGSSPIAIPLTPVTVFVGPNNSGKSLVLTEIADYCVNGPQSRASIVDNLKFEDRSESSAKSLLENIQVKPNPGEALSVGSMIVSGRHGRMQINMGHVLPHIMNPELNHTVYCQSYLRHVILKLDGPSRIGLIGAQQSGDLQNPPQTSFQHLFVDNKKRAEVSRIVKDAVGNYFTIDATGIGNLRIRLAKRPASDETEERGWHQAAVAYHAEAQPIESSSDGVKAFTGIITEVVAGDPKILLIDEPEAFLHPSLAFKLGLELARASTGSDKRIFVSTHSPSFIMGCIQSGVKVNIIRLTYRDGSSTARLSPSDDLLRLMRNPLLRSTGVISGLFYESVIVTEGDADRAFYQEINERMLLLKPDWGIPNCLFLHAQNKQTIATILKPLRELGIPTASIVDIDVIKEGGSVWANFLTSIGMPALSHSSFSSIRPAILSAFQATGKDMKRDGGLDLLSSADREAAGNLLNQLAEYGSFVVPNGELESWLKFLKVGGHGPGWLIPIFEAMGEDPEGSNYVRPGNDDVWAFIKSVRSWLLDPTRKGIPS